MEEKIEKSLILLFSGVFAVIWAGVWLIAAVHMNQSKKICLFAVLLSALFLLAVFVSGKLSRRLRRPVQVWRMFPEFCLS